MVSFLLPLKSLIFRGVPSFHTRVILSFYIQSIQAQPPSLQENFSNSIDRLHVRKVMIDEGLDIFSFPPDINVPKSAFAVLPSARNPFSLLKHFPASSLVPLPEKKTEIGEQLAFFFK